MSRVYFSFSPSSVFCLYPGMCTTCRTISSLHLWLPQRFMRDPAAKWIPNVGKTAPRDVRVQYKLQLDPNEQVTPCQQTLVGSLTLQSHKHTKALRLLSLASCEGEAFVGSNLHGWAVYHYLRITVSFTFKIRKRESNLQQVYKVHSKDLKHREAAQNSHIS